MIKRSVLQEYVEALNMYAPNNGESHYVNQKLTEL